MKLNTILVNPDIYIKNTKPNCINLNNSFSTKKEYEKTESLDYKREDGLDNYLVLKKILSKLYNVSENGICLSSSGLSLATLLNQSKCFNRILCLKNTYPDMKTAYNGLYLENINSIEKNDLICIESYTIPECSSNKDLIEKYINEAKNKNAFVLVDNTYSTCYTFNPFELGVDFVLESLSKFSSGLNNTLGGILLTTDKNKDKIKNIDDLRKHYGFYLDPINCYLIQLGLQTLPIRLDKIKNTIKSIKKYLIENKIQFSVIEETGIVFIKCSENFAKEIMKSITLFQLVDSFGVNFSTINYFKEEYLLRISIGLEDPIDLINSLNEVLYLLKAGQT